jgi:spore germination cell wall hydrolase CwlJ-like protein
MKTLKLGVLATSLLLVGTLGIGTLAPVTPVEARFTDIDCLAKNIYHEARGEPLEGQIAVAQVTLNRVQNPRYHNTVCGVVYAHRQFSWTNSGTKKVKNPKAWQAALDISRAVLTKSVHLPEFRATHFHTLQVKPYWAKTKTRVAVIGNHVFYS